MAKTEHYYTKFEEGKFYHLYNRSTDKQPMFRNEGNYEFFLKQYDLYLSPVVETFAYCLLGNHFHILFKIKDLTGLDLETLQKYPDSQNPHTPHQKTTHDIVCHQLRKFFQSYSMAFNKQHQRIGALFQKPFKRALVDNDAYFMQLIYYIHSNPQHHQLIDDFRDWKWSSYKRILIDKPSKLNKKEVLEWFGDKDKYMQYHSEIQKMNTRDIMLDND